MVNLIYSDVTYVSRRDTFLGIIVIRKRIVIRCNLFYIIWDLCKLYSKKNACCHVAASENNNQQWRRLVIVHAEKKIQFFLFLDTIFNLELIILFRVSKSINMASQIIILVNLRTNKQYTI